VLHRNIGTLFKAALGHSRRFALPSMSLSRPHHSQ
jgi:hypothetical protein